MNLICLGIWYLCSREFRRLAIRSESKRVLRAQDVSEKDTKLTGETKADICLKRHIVPSHCEQVLQCSHPLNGEATWAVVLNVVRSVDAYKEKLDAENGLRMASPLWPQYVAWLSWWDYERCFKRRQNGRSLDVKRTADVVVASPAPRLATASRSRTEHVSACRNALLGYCCHGPKRL